MADTRSLLNAVGMGGFLGLNIVYTYAASGEVTQLPIDVAWACTNLWSGFGILLGPFFSGLSCLNFRIFSRIQTPLVFFQPSMPLRTLPLSPPKGDSKSKFVIFVNKNQFKSNKLCYEVSLYENFQQQSCSRTIPLPNGVYMLRQM